MKNKATLRPFIWVLGGLCLCLSACQPPTQNTSSSSCVPPKSLMEGRELMARLASHQRLHLIEVSKEKAYLEGHLPGAHRIWRPDYENVKDYPYGGMRADTHQLAVLLRSFGVNRGDSLVLYDRRGDVDAVRFLWILATYGYTSTFLIDGGIHRWMAEGLPLVREIPKPTPGNFSFEKQATYLEPVMDIGAVQKALTDPAWLILDTRSQQEYEGKIQKNGAFRRGRIPGSVHLDWMELIHADGDHRFKSCQEIEPLLQERGISPDFRIITYCHSGVRSAHTAFVLREIMGYPYVWNYDGSWTEWSYHPKLPALL